VQFLVQFLVRLLKTILKTTILYMNRLFLLAAVITVLFFLMKWVEIYYLDKSEEPKPVKNLVRDSLIVFISSLTGGYGYFYLHGTVAEFFDVITETKSLNPAATQIFTDDPAF